MTTKPDDGIASTGDPQLLRTAGYFYRAIPWTKIFFIIGMVYFGIGLICFFNVENHHTYNEDMASGQTANSSRETVAFLHSIGIILIGSMVMIVSALFRLISVMPRRASP